MSRRKFLAAAGATAVLGPRVFGAAMEERATPLVMELREAFKDGQPGVEEALRRITSDPKRVIASLGEPNRGGITKLYHDSRITILQIVWAPLMVLRPHDHNMWVSIGVFGGREDNIFWQRKENIIKPIGAESFGVGDVGSLTDDGIHSVVNPVQKLTAAIHVYGGDFFAPGRTSWAGEDHDPMDFDQQGLLEHFENSNKRFNL
ncbi:MAG: hypothetical protein ABFS28_05315 [Bacteroidota bacterium]